MQTTRKRSVALYVDKATQQWIVRDCDGSFWVLPSIEDAWDHRQPFEANEETMLEPVPGHYKYVLGITF